MPSLPRPVLPLLIIVGLGGCGIPSDVFPTMSDAAASRDSGLEDAGPADTGSDAACLCDDGDTCNGVESCDGAGGCLPGVPIDCTALDDGCNMGVCNPALPGCEAVPLPDGTPCDDGLFCTEPDGCEAGVCTGPPRDCSGMGMSCASGCDKPTATCTGIPLPDGALCNDGLFCTVGEICQGGSCQGGSPRDCSAVADGCNVESCNDAADLCESIPSPDGTSCEDGLFCTVSDACQAGTCQAGIAPDCSFLTDPCNTGVCDEAMASCIASPVADATPCDDGLSCTVPDACQGGACFSGPPPDCAAFDGPCTTGQCSELAGGCFADPFPDGTVCADGDPCTVGDVCSGGLCSGVPATEGPPGDPTCGDGADNDCDMLTDAADLDCVCDPFCGGACGPGDCCNEDCSMGGNCNVNCSPSCTCNVDCSDGGDCNVDCTDATCSVDCTNASNCEVACSNNSACDIDCTGANNCDQSRCTSGSQCLLDCTGSGNCMWDACAGGQMSCPGDITVCNQACP